jgi:hypothetical protein
MYEKSIDAVYARTVRKLDRDVSRRIPVDERTSPQCAPARRSGTSPVRTGSRAAAGDSAEAAERAPGKRAAG